MAFDHGILNTPLSKRGDINRQLDAYKADQAKQAAAQNKVDAAARRCAKEAAKVALSELLADLHVLDAKAAKLGVTRKVLVAELTSWSKWEPTKLLSIRNQWLLADGA